MSWLSVGGKSVADHLDGRYVAFASNRKIVAVAAAADVAVLVVILEDDTGDLCTQAVFLEGVAMSQPWGVPFGEHPADRPVHLGTTERCHK